MRAVDVIRRKRDGGELGRTEIDAFVRGVTDHSWPDYQIAALLMAVVWRGMTADEAAALTEAMVRSGVSVDLSSYGPGVADKHSTGGVGDKISLVLAPLAASCGLVVPMMSGRGLGHTGGTLDKLESIPGFRTRLSLDEMRRAIDRTGCALIGQTEDIAPADRRLYALRDVTGTIESVPLISASILSKKIAEGARALVVDVKVGRGAFMKTEAQARELAQSIVRIAGLNGVPTEAVLTAMDAPLGRAVGNAPEVVEALETLKGRGPADVTVLSVLLTARMLVVAGVESFEDAAVARVRHALESGRGLEKFAAIIEQQHGDARVVDDYARLPQPDTRREVRASMAGLVNVIDAETIGRAGVALGAGRDRVDSDVDPSAGIELSVRVGDRVDAGQLLAVVSGRSAARVEEARALAETAFDVADVPPVTPMPIVLGRIGASGQESRA
jgi:pyrimidine-nucleoside phosphorylase